MTVKKNKKEKIGIQMLGDRCQQLPVKPYRYPTAFGLDSGSTPELVAVMAVWDGIMFSLFFK